MNWGPKIPTLSHLQPLTSGYIARVVFQGAGPKDTMAYGLVSNFIRLADRAAAEYEGSSPPIATIFISDLAHTVGHNAQRRITKS
jgi:hypothetical protein